MNILIIGAAGMVGRKLTAALLGQGTLRNKTITRLDLVDVARPPAPEALNVEVVTQAADISDPKTAERLIASPPDVIFHLAAIVSGEAELDFEKGYAVNLDGIRYLLEAIRQASKHESYCPRFVFTSSIAVFGAPFPDKITDDFFQTPRTSYGTQKAIGELLLSDYSRRGFVDGVGIRLPTICIRPGAPNKAASGFFSSILREPLVGQSAVLPVDPSARHWHASPRAAVRFLVHAAQMDTAALGTRRSLNMPGLSATVGEQIEALRRVAGNKAVSLIRYEHDPMIAEMVEGWAKDFDTSRALALGFVAETSFDEIIRIHIEDELGGEVRT